MAKFIIYVACNGSETFVTCKANEKQMIEDYDNRSMNLKFYRYEISDKADKHGNYSVLRVSNDVKTFIE